MSLHSSYRRTRRTALRRTARSLNRSSLRGRRRGPDDLSQAFTAFARAIRAHRRLARLAPQFKTDWNYGNTIQDAHLVLGRLALAEGNFKEAKKRLLDSARSKGSPPMNSFGPNMSLAKDLLAKGEKDTVLAYFELCGKFWTMGADRLKQWAEEVKNGATPDFGANLVY